MSVNPDTITPGTTLLKLGWACAKLPPAVVRIDVYFQLVVERGERGTNTMHDVGQVGGGGGCSVSVNGEDGPGMRPRCCDGIVLMLLNSTHVGLRSSVLCVLLSAVSSRLRPRTSGIA